MIWKNDIHTSLYTFQRRQLFCVTSLCGWASVLSRLQPFHPDRKWYRSQPSLITSQAPSSSITCSRRSVCVFMSPSQGQGLFRCHLCIPGTWQKPWPQAGAQKHIVKWLVVQMMWSPPLTTLACPTLEFTSNRLFWGFQLEQTALLHCLTMALVMRVHPVSQTYPSVQWHGFILVCAVYTSINLILKVAVESL